MRLLILPVFFQKVGSKVRIVWRPTRVDASSDQNLCCRKRASRLASNRVVYREPQLAALPTKLSTRRVQTTIVNLGNQKTIFSFQSQHQGTFFSSSNCSFARRRVAGGSNWPAKKLTLCKRSFWQITFYRVSHANRRANEQTTRLAVYRFGRFGGCLRCAKQIDAYFQV